MPDLLSFFSLPDVPCLPAGSVFVLDLPCLPAGSAFGCFFLNCARVALVYVNAFCYSKMLKISSVQL